MEKEEGKWRRNEREEGEREGRDGKRALPPASQTSAGTRRAGGRGVLAGWLSTGRNGPLSERMHPCSRDGRREQGRDAAGSRQGVGQGHRMAGQTRGRARAGVGRRPKRQAGARAKCLGLKEP